CRSRGGRPRPRAGPATTPRSRPSLRDALPTSGLTDTDIAQALQGVPEAVTKYAAAVAKAQQTIDAAGGETRLADLSELKNTLNEDRKSTRLNSSHVKISYAVSRLKQKTTDESA